VGVWACGRVGVWACGRVGVWACGRVGVWAYGPYGRVGAMDLSPYAESVDKDLYRSVCLEFPSVLPVEIAACPFGPHVGAGSTGKPRRRSLSLPGPGGDVSAYERLGVSANEPSVTMTNWHPRTDNSPKLTLTHLLESPDQAELRPTGPVCRPVSPQKSKSFSGM
jgi:hypothetical protein